MPMSLITLLLLSFLILCCAEKQQQHHLSSNEREALYSLRASLGIRHTNWPINTDPCTNWTGVNCQTGRVVSLNLTGLRRTVKARRNPSFAVEGLRNLTGLAKFTARGFPLPGPIPAAVYGSSSLSFLDLSGCSINGTIPSGIAGGLEKLKYLDLSFNSLSGSLPEFSVGSKLRYVKLGHNKLSGAIPDSIWYVPNLRILDLSNNNLSGTFGYRISGNVSFKGELFNMSGNSYYGPLSSSFQKILSRFKVVDLSGNYFRGNVQLGNAVLSKNCFTGAINQKNSAACEKIYGVVRDGAENDRGRRKFILVGVFGGVALIVIVVAVLTVCFWKCRSTSARHKDRSCEGNRDVVVLDVESEPRQDVVASQPPLPMVLPPSRTVSVNLAAVGDSFAYDELVKATSEFSSRNLMRQGHSGDLYLGVLEDTTKVVVKRINLEVLRRETFLSEINVFAKSIGFSGARVVPFIGHCLESDTEKFLVYKYMPHRDLSSALHKKSAEENEGLQSLDWITRLKIAVGIAEALSFLHHECTPPLVHRDLEASSILLDDKYEVSLGSLSEICTQPSNNHQNVFSRMLRPSQLLRQGISGCSTASCAYDVYCMGKVLLELVTGKLGISGSNNAATNAWLEQTVTCINIHDKSSINKILDPSLKVEEDHLEEVLAVAIIIKSCLDPKPSQRPPARHVLKALENPLKVLRMQNTTDPAWLRTSSSRRSWHGAFIGSLQRNSLQTASVKTMQDQQTSRMSGTETSQTSSGDRSVSRSRASREIFPEP